MSSMILDSHSPEDDESSAHTSAAAADSDDIARLEDTLLDAHGVSPNDFHFGHDDPMAQDTESTIASSMYPHRSGSPSQTLGYETSSSRSNELLANASRTSSSSFDLGAQGGADRPDETGTGVNEAGQAPSGPLPSREEQYAMVKEFFDNPEAMTLVPGDTRFLVSSSWMRRWKGYVGWTSHFLSSPGRPTSDESPGPITNEDILEDDKKTLREYQSAALQPVTRQHWDLIAGWYGGRPIRRRVIDVPGGPMVELYPLRLKVKVDSGANARTRQLSISKAATVAELRRRGGAALGLENVEDYALHELVALTIRSRRLDDDDQQRLGDLLLMDNVAVLFERPGDAERASSDNDSSSTAITTVTWSSDYYSSIRRAATPGAVGLSNLGNTCFMNAAIQCLSHIPQVVTYFGGSDGRQPFLDDLNIDNPLGTRGELARAFGDLVRRMWDGKDQYIFPREFRIVLCNHAQQFLGYDQHDSQEFLAYLLDGVHEDVNRVRHKPYVEKVEANNGEGDEAAARRAWEAHLQRNDSFIVDTMHGQYKSVVTCPVEGCGRTSTTFDPAMYLSVPLPASSDTYLQVVLVTLNGSRRKRYCVGVPKTARIDRLKQALAELCGIKADRLVIAELWQYKLHNVFEDDDLVSSIAKDLDALAYELPDWGLPPPPPPTDESCCGDRDPNAEKPGDGKGGAGGVGGSGEGWRGSGAEGGGDEAEEAGAGWGAGWFSKLAPFVLSGYRAELRKAGDAFGRRSLLKKASVYLDRFPDLEELERLERDESSEVLPEAASSDGEPKGMRVRERLKEASTFECLFRELNTAEEVAGFMGAVASLRELVLHEQAEVKVQVVQHRGSEFESFPYGRPLSSYSSRYSRRSTPFSIPLLLSYLPHATTVGEFRNRVALLLRRHVLPRDLKRRVDEPSMELEASGLEEGEVSAADEGDSETSTLGPGDPGNVMHLIRSRELQLFWTDPETKQSINIFDGGDGHDDELISDILEEPEYGGMSKLALRWSPDAIREAFDATEADEVTDDPSVAACRDEALTALSIAKCLEHFLQREQLDDTEMWYCSRCKEHRRAYKELSLWRLPPVLIIHLKRFSYDTQGGWGASRDKIDNMVTFSVRGLDMRAFETVSRVSASFSGKRVAEGNLSSSTRSGAEDSPMDDWVVVGSEHQSAAEGSAAVRAPAQAKPGAEVAATGAGAGIAASACSEIGSISGSRTQGGEAEGGGQAIYDLCGTVNHYGGLGGGHYTAFALNDHDSRWYEFSDDRVSIVESEADLVTSAAYVLFYQRRGAGVGNRGGNPIPEVGGDYPADDNGGALEASLPRVVHE